MLALVMVLCHNARYLNFDGWENLLDRMAVLLFAPSQQNLTLVDTPVGWDDANYVALAFEGTANS